VSDEGLAVAFDHHSVMAMLLMCDWDWFIIQGGLLHLHTP